MKMKKIAAAVLGSSLRLSAVPSFAAKTAILKVYMDAPVPQACDITLNGQRTASAQLGRVDFSQPDTIMSRDVRVQIRCNENRVAKLRLSDDRLGTIDPGSIPWEENWHSWMSISKRRNSTLCSHSGERVSSADSTK